MPYLNVYVDEGTILRGSGGDESSLASEIQELFPLVDARLIDTTARGASIPAESVVTRLISVGAMGRNSDAPIHIDVISWPDWSEDRLEQWMKLIANALQDLLIEQLGERIQVAAEPVGGFWCGVYYCTKSRRPEDETYPDV